MRKFITLFAVLGLVLALAPAAQASIEDPNVVPTDGYDVGAYRLIFTTSGTYDAIPTDIATYNARVEDAATNTTGDAIDLSDITGWKMIGSTVAMNARDNTGTTATDGEAASGDVPIYNVDGVRVADDNAALWGVSFGAYCGTCPPLYYTPPANALLAPILSITGGNSGARIWTGTAADGSSHVGNELGTPGAGNVVSQGRGAGYLDANWISEGPTGNPNPPANNYHHHALSPVLRIPPPLGTMILLQ